MHIACIIPSSLSRANSNKLNQCLRSLQTASQIAKTKLEITIVTENKTVSSNPDSHQSVIVNTSKDKGFAGMNNYAIGKTIATTSASYFLLINDDAWIDKYFFKNLKELLHKQAPDLVIPLTYCADKKTTDSFGVEYFRSGYAKNNHDSFVATTLASASCLLISSSFLKKLKQTYGFYFNPLLHYYLEDVELCIRSFMINASFYKEKSLVAYHHGSSTSGKKSYFIMYQTYRNILWLIILTWPSSAIARHIFSILAVQAWVLFFSLCSFGPKLYLTLLKDTVEHWGRLMKLRQKIIPRYNKTIAFTTIFSRYSFRTYHGITFKFS